MNKEDLIEGLHKGANLPTKKQAGEIIEWFFDTITKTLSRGEEVAVTGFGTFRVDKRKARMGRNPKTGESMQIPAKSVPKFKAGKLLKDAVK